MKKRDFSSSTNVELGSVAKKAKKKGKKVVGKRKRRWGRGTNTMIRDAAEIDSGLKVFSHTLASGIEGKEGLDAIYHRRDLVRQRMKQIVIQKPTVKVSIKALS